MKKFLFAVFFVCISSTYCFATSWGEIGECSTKSATITVVSLGSAKYLGVTATLTNGEYYDFPAVEISMATYKQFSLPDQYSAVSWEGRLWKKKKTTDKSWSDRVVNHQGYVMKNPVGESVTCSP